jgi:predicted AlkP superfamily phosphohydrolase/phosphomutase
MHRALTIAASLLVATAVAGTSQARVVVIGIDGGSWNAIDPLIAAGELPNLAALVARGGAADLDTVEPLTSPVVWTSIATGRRPEVHGVSDFFSTRTTIPVPTIYERLAARGRRVGLYEVLMTWPPPALPGGFVVPGWLRRDDTTWPPDALEGRSVFRTVYQAKPSNRDYLEQAWQEGARKPDSWKALVERFDPEIGALTFYAVDATAHRTWHASYPEQFAAAIPEIRDDERGAVQRALREVDRGVGEIVADLDLDGSDSVIIVSDHGFRPVEGRQDVWITRFEDLLAKHGLESGRDGFSLVSTFFAVTIRVAPGPFDERDRLIDRLTTLLESYRTREGEALLSAQVLDVAERPPGMERSLYERARQWVVRRLMDWAFSAKVDPTAHAMIVALPDGDALEALWPDGEIEVDGEPMPVRRAIHRQRFTGTHDPTAIFIAAGRGIARRSARDRLSVLDVAPLVAYLADEPIPDDLEGRLPERWIQRGFANAHPPRRVSAAEWPTLAERATALDPEATASGGEDPALVEKLRALGYIE